MLQFLEHTASSERSVGTANGFDVIDVDALEKVRPELCQKFAELTDTTPEFAATFLPGYNYDLQVCVISNGWNPQLKTVLDNSWYVVQAAVNSFWTDLPSPVTPLKRSLSATKTEAKNE